MHLNEINYKLHKKISKSAFEDAKADFEKLFNTVEDDIVATVTDLTENL